uniref:Uncharacterized protein n=1 Tax=Anopheles culicifacies TaxID=139723 RepID=A0A182MKI2_9DIPT
MAAKLFFVASLLVVAVAPFTTAGPLGSLPINLRSNLGAQKNLDVQLPDGSSSITAETINNLAIVFADTVYIMSDGSVVPENPTTTVVPPVSSTTMPPNGSSTGGPVITPPTFPGRK